jgi:hypothetical protein
MFTILGGDGQEYGPVTVQQIRSWISAGRANLDTQAKAVGSDEWRRLGDYAEFAEPGDVPPIITPSSSASTAAAATGTATTPSEIMAPREPLNIFGCLDRSFALWKSHFLALVGATLLVVFVQMIISFIPVVGSLAGFVLNGVFYGGLYYFYLGKIRGEERKISDVFAGFSRAFVPLMGATLLTNIIFLAIALIFFRPLVSALFAAAKEGSPHLPELPPATPLSLLSMLVGVILLAYISVAWAFTFGLIIDKRLGAWTAMEVSRRVITRQWFRVFIVGLLGGLLAMLGLIGLFVGVFLTLPLAFGALLYAYEDLCTTKPVQPHTAGIEPDGT